MLKQPQPGSEVTPALSTFKPPRPPHVLHPLHGTRFSSISQCNHLPITQRHFLPPPARSDVGSILRAHGVVTALPVRPIGDTSASLETAGSQDDTCYAFASLE